MKMMMPTEVAKDIAEHNLKQMILMQVMYTNKGLNIKTKCPEGPNHKVVYAYEDDYKYYCCDCDLVFN